jgi:hypothetical protein
MPEEEVRVMKAFSGVPLLVAVLMLCSCVRATKDEVVAFAGKGAYNGRDFSLVWDHDESVKSIVTGAVAAATLGVSAYSDSVSAAVSTNAANNATKQAVNASNNATKVQLGEQALKAKTFIPPLP